MSMVQSPGADLEEDGKPKKVMFRFCSECSNLLFPKEDRATKELLYSCRTCAFKIEAPNACVMRHEVGSTVGDTAGITTDIGQDPTLPRAIKPCPKCQEPEQVFFQSQQRTAETGMKLYYVCTNTACGHVWQQEIENER